MHHYHHDQVCHNRHPPMTKLYLSQTKKQIKARDKVLWIKMFVKIQSSTSEMM